MKYLSFLLLLIPSIVCAGDTYKTMLNPYTGKFDFVNKTVSTTTMADIFSSTNTWTGGNTFQGSTGFKVTATSYSVTLDNTYSTVVATNTVTITLPTTSGISGREYYIVYRGTSTCTVNTTSSELINDQLTQTLYPYDAIHIKSDGIGWWVE